MGAIPMFSQPPVDDLSEVDLTKLRIAFAPTFPGIPVAAESRHAIKQASPTA